MVGAASMWLCGLLVSAFGAHVLRAECPHEPSGKTLKRWSQASSWPESKKPSDGSEVVIADDVLLDESPPELISVTVNAGASLVFSPKGDFTLTTKYLMLYGALHIGSEDCRFTAKAKILLTGSNGEYNITGFGEKFIGVASGATLELYGQNKLSWAKLTSTIPKLKNNNGVLYRKRGFVAYVTNGTAGEVLYKKSVTFMGSHRMNYEPDELVEALNGTGEGDVIALAVQWNAISDEIDMEPIYDAVEKALYGEVTKSSKVRQIKEFDAWALIAVKGEFVKEALTTISNARGRRVASVTTVVPHGNDQHVMSVSSVTRPAHYQSGQTDITVTTLAAGARVLDMSHDVTTWRPGDKLMVMSTDFDWNQAEEAEVTYCSAEECSNRQIKVLMVNDYTHFGEITDGVDERAEVMLVSRNIVIEGQTTDACPASNGNCNIFKEDTFGGHITVEAGFDSVHIDGVSLHHMGQPMHKDRHPIFFHQCGDVDAAGNYSNPTYVRSTSITESFSKCIVLSGTHGLTIEDNAAFDHYSHCIFLKDGGEKRTIIDGNLVAGTREQLGADGLDRKGTSFLITNPVTYFRNNIAAGGDKRGIWYLFPYEPVGESAGKGFMQSHEARHTAHLEFSNNAVHSYRYGLTMDNRLNSQGADSEGANIYQPKVDPLDDESEDAVAYVSRLTAFKNRERNVFMRGGYYVVRDSSFADSASSFLFSRVNGKQPQFLENSVLIGESDNIGEPTLWYVKELKKNVLFDRSLPVPWDLKRPMRGFITFDGPVYLDTVWFNKFVSNDNRTASALGFPGNWHWPQSTVSEVSRLAFGFDDELATGQRMFDGNSSAYWFGDRDGDLEVTLRDKDGSLTGSAGSTVVRNYPVYTTSQCYYRSLWNLAVCPHKYGKLSLWAPEGRDGKSSPVLTRDDVDPEDGLQMPYMYYTQYPVILGGSHSYIMHWPDFLPETVSITGNGFEKDQGVRFGICVPRDAELELWSHNPQWRPRRNLWKEVSSVEALDRDNDEGDRYFCDKTNGIIFFKMINPRTRCEDFKGECKDGCPYIRVILKSGNASDSDCRDRISSYARDPIDAAGGLTYQPLSASPMPAGIGARGTVPFESRPSLNGGYGEWTKWGACSTTCGGGTQLRTRACDSPMPQHDGRACEGPREEIRACGTTPCEINGDFEAWSSWTSCQSLPDNERKGMQTRTRQCNNPTPQYNGLSCMGITDQMQGCLVGAMA